MYFTEDRTNLPREAIGPSSPWIAFRGGGKGEGSMPIFLIKPIAICDFPEGRVRISPPPSGSAHELSIGSVVL